GLRPRQAPLRRPVQQAGSAQRDPAARARGSAEPDERAELRGGGAQGRRRVRHAEGGGQARPDRAPKGRMMQAGTERPRFRQDLFAEAVDEQGAKYIDVMDPDTGGVFRFYEVEFSIACAMDGERDVPGLVQWARDELGVTPTTNEVLTVIATLGDLGYLDMAAAARTPAAAPKVPTKPVPAGAPPGTTSEVSLDLSEHLAVGKEDVKEALRQSRVMAAVEVPAGLDAPSTPAPVEVKPPDRPLRPVTPAPVARPESRPPERPV